MKKDEIKDRLDKVDERVLALMKRYPFVFAAVLLIGMAIGGAGIAIFS